MSSSAPESKKKKKKKKREMKRTDVPNWAYLIASESFRENTWLREKKKNGGIIA